jgi:hypothetical protein
MNPKYDVMNMADDDIVLASVAKLYKSEMRLAVAEVERLKAEVERLTKQAKGMSKAGWSLVNAHQYGASISYWNKCINDWQNADKGVQS